MPVVGGGGLFVPHPQVVWSSAIFVSPGVQVWFSFGGGLVAKAKVDA